MNDLQQFKQTYITECFELIADMEEHLLGLNIEQVDKEQLNAIFRCAHSIKGGSGAFGLTYLTNFTHVLEALLDAMRDGKVDPSREAVDVLLQSVDIVTQMIEAAKSNIEPPHGLGDDVLARLQQFIEKEALSKPAVEAAVSSAEAIVQNWKIYFAPRDSLFASGNEPLLILRELSELGNSQIIANTDSVPLLADLDPTTCYIHWDITLTTDKPEAKIREVFEFVEDHCELKIEVFEAPAATVEDFPSPIYGGGLEWEQPLAQSEQKVAPLPSSPRKREEEYVPQAPEAKAAKEPSAATSIRVDIEKVDRLVNMVGELVITEAMLRAQTRAMQVDQFSDLLRGIDELSQHTRELQEAVMAVRMQPVKSIFSRMPRIVRDLSTQLGKDIRLEMSGENTEVDKTVIEQLGDPLTHMIRNSVDHGIEKPADRVKAGKPEQGVIHLLSFHSGGRIVIEIRDDGKGIDRDRVLAKAKEKKLIAADAVLSDEECDNLIFVAGFSTAEVVSNVSGRGVGMDVVRRNIEALGGTVRVNTQPGKGSIFTITLPLTLAILDGMIVRVGTENYIIAITSIIETLRPRKEDIRRVEGHSDVINVRGELIPLVYLHQLFSINNALQDPSKALVVLVENGREKIGVMVDELIGQQQVVIKSLEENADAVEGISGATILGDGKVSLILDIPGLCRIRKIIANSLSRQAA
jgi:two-component system chemotaxis sensor kinase CheA